MEGKGWVDAKDLKADDKVRKADGTSGEVKQVKVETSRREMYNLTVDHVHTFFVGDGQWLVHNVVCPIRNEGDVFLFHGSRKGLDGGKFDLEMAVNRRDPYHLTNYGVYLTDDPIRAITQYATPKGEVGITTVPYDFAQSIMQIDQVEHLTEYVAITQEQVDILNDNLVVVSTSEAIEMWRKGLFK